MNLKPLISKNIYKWNAKICFQRKHHIELILIRTRRKAFMLGSSKNLDKLDSCAMGGSRRDELFYLACLRLDDSCI